MTVDERVSLCRFLEKVEKQEAYCISIGVRDVSGFDGRKTARGNRAAEENRKRTG